VDVGSQQEPASPIAAWLGELHATYKDLRDGTVASYIPELLRANPDHFGICMVSVDGHTYAIGDCDVPFTIQSISKPFVFGLALEDHGRDAVLARIGVEPSGEAFNAIAFDTANRPFNPMVNAGAIAAAGLVKGRGLTTRAARVVRFMERFAGRKLDIDDAVFLSERATGHRNRAIGHLERNFSVVDDRVEEHLDLYFTQCSILVTARDLAMMAATLANGGVNPVTGESAMSEQHVKYVLAVMSTCGMYDFAGEWLYRIGLPAKSGVGGGIIAVLPGQFGIATYSPPLDAHGNSVRGIRVFQDLSDSFDLHMFDAPSTARAAVVRHYRGDKITSERIRAPDDAALLKSDGTLIAVYELQGDLILASVEQLVRRLVEDSSPTRFVILDWRRVWRVGESAAALLRRTIAAQHAAGRRVILAGLLEGDERRDRLVASGIAPDAFLDDLDEALEWAEDRLLQAARPPADAGPPADDGPLALERMDLLHGLSPDQLAAVTALMEHRAFRKGDIVFPEGAYADRVYFLTQGRASIFITTDEGEERRLAGISAGATFGEMAAFDGKPRSAGVRADTDIACLALGIAALRGLHMHDPATYAAIMSNVVRILVFRLRRADERLKALR